MIKDDQGGTRNPYKFMNIMKQDAIDDKIRERCRTCEKKCMQEGLDRSSSYQAEANLDGSRICWRSIGQTESFLMDWESIEKPSRQSPESSMDRDCINFCQDKKKNGLDR